MLTLMTDNVDPVEDLKLISRPSTQNSRLSIEDLPDEVLADVFFWSLPSHFQDPFGAAFIVEDGVGSDVVPITKHLGSDLDKLCSVCARWRHVAISARYLWSHFTFEPKIMATSALKRWLERSGSLPLTFFVLSNPSPCQGLEIALGILAGHFDRWKSVRMVSSALTVKLLLHIITGKISRHLIDLKVERLRNIAWNEPLVSDRPAATFDPASAPCLELLQLPHGCLAPTPNLLFNALQEIRMIDTVFAICLETSDAYAIQELSANGFLALLNACPQLRVARLAVAGFQPVYVPDNMITLNKLEELSVSVHQGLHPPLNIETPPFNLGPALSVIFAPSLKILSLKVGPWCHIELQHAAPLITSDIEQLNLCGVHFREQDLLQFLHPQALPYLCDLHINVKPDLLVGMDAFCHSLSYSVDGGIPCPRLATFSICGGLLEGDAASEMVLARSRRPSEDGPKSLRLELRYCHTTFDTLLRLREAEQKVKYMGDNFTLDLLVHQPKFSRFFTEQMNFVAWYDGIPCVDFDNTVP